MKEINQRPKVISPLECLVESGFCAFLVLRYTDPENPQLEAMNSVWNYDVYNNIIANIINIILHYG